MAASTVRPKFTVIMPKRPIVRPNRAAAITALTRFGDSLTRAMGTYPPSRSTYRRTGELGRRWSRAGPKREGNAVVVRVGNNAKSRPSRRYPQGFGYGQVVQGFRTREPKQRALFRRYGWPSIETEANKFWKEYRPAIVAALHGRVV